MTKIYSERIVRALMNATATIQVPMPNYMGGVVALRGRISWLTTIKTTGQQEEIN